MKLVNQSRNQSRDRKVANPTQPSGCGSDPVAALIGFVGKNLSPYSYDYSYQSLARYSVYHWLARRLGSRRLTGQVIEHTRTSSGSWRCRYPFSERQALAESFGIAAGRLEQGENRLLVDEYLRTNIAAQPGSGRWANNIGKILQTAASPDAVKYAENLRQIAKGLQHSSTLGKPSR